MLVEWGSFQGEGIMYEASLGKERIDYLEAYGKLAILSFLSHEESLKFISHVKTELRPSFAFEGSRTM